MTSPLSPSSKYQVPAKLFKRLGEESGSSSQLLASSPGSPMGSMRSLVSSPRAILSKSSMAARGFSKATSSKVLSTIPPLLRDCVEYLRDEDRERTEGLFRIPGDSDKVDRLMVLYEDGGDTDDVLEDEKASAHDVATLLKRYLMRMPSPLVDEQTRKDLIGIVQRGTTEGKDKQLIAYEVCVRCLEIESDKRSALSYLLRFLNIVGTTEQGVNKMTVENLAKVFAPIILREGSPSSVTQTQLQEQKKLIDLSIVVCEILIWNAQEIVPKPASQLAHSSSS